MFQKDRKRKKIPGMASTDAKKFCSNICQFSHNQVSPIKSCKKYVMQKTNKAWFGAQWPDQFTSCAMFAFSLVLGWVRPTLQKRKLPTTFPTTYRVQHTCKRQFTSVKVFIYSSHTWKNQKCKWGLMQFLNARKERKELLTTIFNFLDK